jgi:hypothetical protein
MRWNIYITDALNLLQHVSALHGCHHQGVLTVVKAVLSKWFLACSTATRLHTYYNFSLKHMRNRICYVYTYIQVHVRLIS